MSGLFHEKKGLVTGVFNKQSLAWAIADRVLAEGATCGFTHMPDRPDDERRKNESRVRKLIDGRDRVAFLQPMDVTADDQIDAVAATCADQLGKLDFLVHSVAFAPPEDLKKDTVDCSREGFKLAMAISVHSLMALVSATKDLMNPGASVLTLTYYGGEKTVPGYNVMGVCKAALDATVRYLAYEMGPRGVRVNALSPGAMQTVSGRGAGVDEMLKLYEAMAPLGRNVTHEEVGKSGVYLLSDFSSGVTGEILHLDGGYNAMGSPGRMLEQIKAAQG